MDNYWPDHFCHFLCLLCCSLLLKEQGKQGYEIMQNPSSKGHGWGTWFNEIQRVGQAHTHSACAVFFDKKTELFIYRWNSSNWWQQLRFNFSKTELFIDFKAWNQRKEEKCCTGQQNYFGKQFIWLFSLRENNHQWSNSSTVVLQNHLNQELFDSGKKEDHGH